MNKAVRPEPIDCSLHDYLEIACLFHYEVRVTLQDGSSIEGQAFTTHTLSDKPNPWNFTTHMA